MDHLKNDIYLRGIKSSFLKNENKYRYDKPGRERKIEIKHKIIKKEYFKERE